MNFQVGLSTRLSPAWGIIPPLVTSKNARRGIFVPLLPASAGNASTGEAIIAASAAHLVVLNTCPDADTAGRIAADLVERGLAACVQALPGLQSYFHWDGKVECAQEHLLLIKTSAASYPALERRITALHPYQLPEIIAVPVSHGLPDYLSWVNDQSSGQTICTATTAHNDSAQQDD